MTCRHAEELIQSGLDGALTPPERARLDAHLAACAGCRAAWDEHQRMARLARRWVAEAGRTPDNGDAFTAQVLARIAAHPASVPARPVLWLPLAATALLVSALAFVPHLVTPALPAVSDLIRALPSWLLANSRALPADMATAWAAAQATALFAPWVWSALLATGLVNGLFYARAAQSRSERSLR